MWDMIADVYETVEVTSDLSYRTLRCDGGSASRQRPAEPHAKRPDVTSEERAFVCNPAWIQHHWGA